MPNTCPPIERLTSAITKWTGSNTGVLCAVVSQIVWLFYALHTGFSSKAQGINDAVTSIIPYLMLFLIQKSQNKDSKAIHLKLDEVIFALENGRNDRLGIENLNERELDQMKKEYD